MPERAVVESAATLHPHLPIRPNMAKVGTFNVVSWDAIDQVITDRQLPQSARRHWHSTGSRVTMAPLASLVAGAGQG